MVNCFELIESYKYICYLFFFLCGMNIIDEVISNFFILICRLYEFCFYYCLCYFELNINFIVVDCIVFNKIYLFKFNLIEMIKGLRNYIKYEIVIIYFWFFNNNIKNFDYYDYFINIFFIDFLFNNVKSIDEKVL